ncbi:PREDICTED: cytochrome P450 9e2-like [Dinoponera quadriceps]|uniref:Cytochrome P450 9e2-like n=1 Tax=Dinoponera quadriceps TaxID=609295 RepID=A0A6P3X9Q8_DINQU|nr:PREDICTED: cytochrome P450 9e2-like [Dinoponera quadriceps]
MYDMHWTILLSIVIGTLGIYYFFSKRFHYFKRHNVIHVLPFSIFGDLWPIIFRQISFAAYIQKLYTSKPDAKYFGAYAMMKPIIFLRDPEIMKEVLIKNFDAFPNREGFGLINDPLFSKNLFSLQGQKWRDVRTLLSPAFTSSKMRTMFILMSECAVEFVKSLSKISADKGDMDMKDAFTRYTNDVIATCAFGIKVDSMSDPTNKFYVNGKDASSFQGLRSLKLIMFATFPRLMQALGWKFLKKDVREFFQDIVKDTIDTRDAKNITRPDMIQLMMDVRGKREAERELTIEEITAQAFIFFLGGFETSSTAMCFTAQEIAANPDVQAKLRQEIDKALEDSNGEATYEVINRLGYLDAVINESLRLHPPLVSSERQCERDYELPPALPSEKPFILKKGMSVWIPHYALQRDEKYFDDPDKFRPERFLDDNAYHNSPCYAPFGLGPRMCIASRFAILEIKVLLFHLLARCELKPGAKAILPIKLSKSAFMMAPEGGFWLRVKRRNDVHFTIGSTTTLDNNVDNFGKMF